MLQWHFLAGCLFGVWRGKFTARQAVAAGGKVATDAGEWRLALVMLHKYRPQLIQIIIWGTPVVPTFATYLHLFGFSR